MPLMLLILDSSTAAADLTGGRHACTKNGCGGVLGPLGLRPDPSPPVGAGATQPHTPRRARCRSCSRTHVLVPKCSYPRRPDSTETVGTALLAAAGGLGHRRVAAHVGLLVTTVRGWLRRARANSETIQVNATIARPRSRPAAGPDRTERHPVR